MCVRAFHLCTRSYTLVEMKIFKVIASVLALSATMLVGAYPAGAYGAPFGDLTISGPGIIGSDITLSGDDFESSTLLSITFSLNESGVTVRQDETSSDAGGAFSQQLEIDERTLPGTYTVTVTGSTVDGATRQLAGVLVIEEELDVHASATSTGAAPSVADSDDSVSTGEDSPTGTSDESTADVVDGEEADSVDEEVQSVDEDAAGPLGGDGGSSSGVPVFVWIVVALGVLGGGVVLLRSKGKLVSS